MEYTDKEFCIEVWGENACFTRPELKVERVSYDVITPSAARAIFQAIFWKPAFNWQITKIEVLNPIKWESIRRNEVGATASAQKPKPIYIEDKRQQRNTIMLKDVKYRLWAKLVFIPKWKRGESKNPLIDAEEQEMLRKNENPAKYNAMFQRRASKGQCFTQPYLGTREFAASFRLVDPENEQLQPAIADNRNLGLMLYDMDYTNQSAIQPMFFMANMCKGVIIVPPLNSEQIKR